MIGWLLCLLACARTVEEVPAVDVDPAEEVVTAEPEPEGPRFRATRLADVVALGDCEGALALIPTDASPAERLARGHCLLSLGRPEEALEALEIPAGDPLEGWFRWRRAQALLALDRSSEVPAILEEAALPGPAGLELRWVRAKAASDVAELRALGKTAVGPRALLDLAERVEGDERERLLQDLWADARAPWDQQAAEALGGEPTDEAVITRRIEGLKRANRHAERRILLERRHPAPSARGEHLILAWARFYARAYPEAIESWQAALGPPEQASGGPSELFHYALTYARTGDYDTAATIYRRLMAAHPTHERADFASLKLGYMAWDKGDCARAVPLLREHQAARPGSKHLDEALWFEARCHLGAGALDEAYAALARLLRDRAGSSLAPGAAYWQARIEGMRGDEATERAGLEAVLSRYPDSGYAWFAAERLGRAFPARPLAEPPPWPAALAEHPRVRAAEGLLSVGLRDEARAELDALEVSGREGRLALAWARIAAGDYRGGRAAAQPWCGSPWKAGDPVAQQACWPRPEEPLVAQAAALHGLPALLPYAIMSAESALDPSVTSPAGARGLMQLMPEVAADLHLELFGPADTFRPQRLYSGPYNALLGTWELGRRHRSLAGTLDGQALPAVVASYNAGEEPVRRWLSAFDGPPPPDAFAEDVGYTETRLYVKRVLGFLMAWRHVYGDDPLAEADE